MNAGEAMVEKVGVAKINVNLVPCVRFVCQNTREGGGGRMRRLRQSIHLLADNVAGCLSHRSTPIGSTVTKSGWRNAKAAEFLSL